MIKKNLDKSDWVFVGLLGIILIFGLIMLSSASSVIAYDRFQDNYYYIKRQLLFGLLPGLVLFFAGWKIDYRFWRRLAFPALLISIILLVAVFLPGFGVSIGGATRWLKFGSIVFQPAELVKLAFLIYLASWLDKRGDRGVGDFSYGLVPFIITLGIIMGLIILQPDVGTMSIVVLTSLSVYFVAGAQIKHLFSMAVLGVFFLGYLIKTAPYRAARLTVFLNPETDPRGIGYHINQALLAVGSGGVLGVGLGLSRQKHLYLPEVIGDSIFAIIAEELGFVGVVVLTLFFGLLVYRGFKIAWESPDLFGRYLGAGISAWIGWQYIVNVGAMIGVLPLTGLPLPFVSYGGTALAILLFASGILVNISKYRRV